MNAFHPTSVQVQTEAKRSQSAGGVMAMSGQRSVRSQQLASNQPRKSVDEQFERTTKLVLNDSPKKNIHPLKRNVCLSSM